MAGFLAPQISGIGAARGGSAPPADTSVGDALVGISKIFDAAFSSRGGGGAQPTQKDRDTETLKPFAQDISRLFAQRDKLGSRQYNARISSTTSAFAVANPQLISESQTLVEAITGIKIGTDEFDFAGETTKTVIDWFLNDPEGRVAAPGAYRFDDNGELNTDLTIIAGVAAMAQASADDARLVGLKTLLGIEEAKSGINELRLKGVVDEWLFKFGNESQEYFEGLVRGFLASGATVADGATVLAQLRDARAQLANKYESKARAGGFANHPDWDVSIALRSFDNAITNLVDRQEDIPRIFEALRAADGTTLGTVLKAAGIPGAFQRETWEYFLNNLLVIEGSNIAELAKGLGASKTIETLVDRPLFTPEATPITEKTPPVEGGSATPEAKAAGADLSRTERQGEVKFGLANFGAYLTENAKDESYRATAVKGFALASLAMTTSPQPVGVDIFDKTYDTKFFDTYKSIVSFGDESSGKLQNEVTHNLVTIFSQREGLARQVLSNFFPSLPSLGLNFVDNKINLVFTTFGPGATELEKSFLARLDQLGLSRDLAGILELEKTGKGFLSATGFGPNLVNLENLNKEISYLNKIVSTIVRLPDLSGHLLPKIEKGFTTRPVFNTVEEYNTTYPNLPHGQEYWIVGEDGKLTLEKKGFESFLFKGDTGDE